MTSPIFAILYDFDRTLSPRDMQEYQFIPSLGLTAAEFWNESNRFGDDNEMDKILAYMYEMLFEARKRGIQLTRQSLVDCGKSVELFESVESWFGRINEFGIKNNVTVEHYVLSSGLKEIIEGTSIGKYFKKIYASEFLYDDDGVAVFPKLSVNYTSKTQFVYRINKGILDINNDRDLNSAMPDDEKRVMFQDMLYIGDGLSDVPCMKLVKEDGGASIAVYNPEEKCIPSQTKKLLTEKRVDFVFPADYSEGCALEKTVKSLIERTAVAFELRLEHSNQLRDISDDQMYFSI